MKVMDALSDVRYGKEGLTDIPIPIVSSAQAYIDAKIPHWVYYCCCPQGPWLNRFMDTPLTKVRMSGWLFYRLGPKGFLHWGFNYWHEIGFEETARPVLRGRRRRVAGHPVRRPVRDLPGPGRPDRFDPLGGLRRVAPGLRHPPDARASSPTTRCSTPLKSYADFPKDEAWLRRALGAVLKSPRHPAGR